MPVYRIEKTSAIYAYVPPGQMCESVAKDILQDAEWDGGEEEELTFFEDTNLDDDWREGFIYHLGKDDLTGEEALSLP